MTNTIPVVTSVSLRVGHVTFEASCRTWRIKAPGFTFAIILQKSFIR
jgi:hypothetical protein